MTFNPNLHLIKIGYGDKAQDYLQVMWRIVWFRENCPDGTIDTEEIIVDLDREVESEELVWNPETRRKEKVIKRGRGYARFKAVVTDGKGGRATGTKSENAASFPDYIEKCETGAIGRALAGLGYGTQFTGQEFDEGTRIVDSPVTFPDGNETAPTSPAAPVHPVPGQSIANDTVNESQLATIRNLCGKLQTPESPDVESMTYLAAKTYIQSLTSQMNAKLKASKVGKAS